MRSMHEVALAGGQPTRGRYGVGVRADEWAAELAAWAIDPDILAAAPESPYTLPPELFRAHHGHGSGPPSPLLDLAREALPAGGSVLDVGAGAGASSLPLVPPAARLVAVDGQPSMLAEVVRLATERGVDLMTHHGRWPDVAGEVETCDVVVCGHVFYNVPDLPAFAAALTAHARHRVVAELHDTHPWVDLGPLWTHFHGQPRPAGPTADLAVAVLSEAGISPSSLEWERPAPDLAGPLGPAYISFTRRRLCLPADREPEVAALLLARPQVPRRTHVLWWDG